MINLSPFENDQEPAYPREKELFYQTTKFKPNNLFGRESLLQVKKRIGAEATKVPHHRRMLTESKALPNLLDKKFLHPKPAKRENRRRGSEERVQIIEPLENPEGVEECKSDIIAANIEGINDKIDRQIFQAQQLIAKVTQNNIDMDEIDLEDTNSPVPESPFPNAEEEHDDPSIKLDTAENIIDITVGEVLKDVAILVTSEYHLFAWPIDMLPRGVKKGYRLSFLITRNNDSELLRKNSIFTQQNEILKNLPK